MTETVAATLADGVAVLTAAGVAGAARDARILMAAALDAPADRLTLRLQEGISDHARARFGRFVADRARFRPVAQILGRRGFWGREFQVSAAVLDPRPETETLIALALAGPPAERVLDLGTGSGAILVTLLAEWPGARGTGTDVDAAALAVATANAARHAVLDRATLMLADWLEGVDGSYDLVASNPPYLAEREVADLAPDVRDWEPRAALVAGPTGLESYRRIAAGLARALAPSGRALFEIGVGQGPDVARIFEAAGYAQVLPHSDLDGRARVVEVRR